MVLIRVEIGTEKLGTESMRCLPFSMSEMLAQSCLEFLGNVHKRVTLQAPDASSICPTLSLDNEIHIFLLATSAHCSPSDANLLPVTEWITCEVIEYA